MAEELYRDPKSPYWYYQVPILDSNGQVLRYERKSTRRKDQAEARRFAQVKLKAALDRGQYGVKEDPLLLEFIAKCIDVSKAVNRPNLPNEKNYQRWLELQIAKRGIRISQLNRPLLSALRTTYLLDGHAESTCNNLMTYLISIYNKAREDGLAVADGQAADFKGLKKKVKWKTRYMSQQEEEQLLFELDPKREHAVGLMHSDWRVREVRCPLFQQMLQDQYDLAIVLTDTGLRVSEATTSGLWSSVDTVNFSSLNFYREKVDNRAHLVCTDRVSDILERRWRTNGNSPYIFSTRRDPMKPRGGTSGKGGSGKGIREAIKRANLNPDYLVHQDGRFTAHHTFRHTFASRLVQAGMSLYAVAGLLGHSREQGTAMTQRYAHLQPERDAVRAAEILNGVAA